MSIFSKFKQSAGAIFKQVGNALKGGVPLSFFIPGGIGMGIITKPDALDFYRSWAYRCIDLRSNALAAIEFKLYQLNSKGMVEEILEHELLDLLYRPNPATTKFDFLKLSHVYTDIYGASPWIMEGGINGAKPVAIYMARPEFMREKKDSLGNTIGYIYRIGQFIKEYTTEEVLFLKNYNPRNPDIGLGVIEAVRQIAQQEDYIAQHNIKLLENGARPSGYLEFQGNLGDKEIKRLKKEFKDQYQGYENAHKVYLLQGGGKFTPAQMSNKDLEFLAARQMNREEICGIFGVPKPLLGFTDATRASAQTSEYIFARWTLEPLASKYFEQLNEFLVPRYGDNLWLWYEPLAKEDDMTVVNEKDKAVNRWKTTNEIRAEEGLSPLTGGDIIYMPLSNMPMMRDEGTSQDRVGKVIQMEAKNQDYLAVDSKTQKYITKRILNRNLKLKKLANQIAEKAINKLFGEKKIVFHLVPDKKAISDEQIQTFYKNRMAEEGALENLWEKGFTSFFNDQKARFLEKLDINFENLKSVESDLKIDPKQELQSTINIITPLMYQTLMKGSQAAADLIGQPAILDMGFFKTWLDKVSDETGTEINDTTIQAFADTLDEGIAAGEGLGELKTRVENVFDFATATRATMIARTETARGVTEAHREMYQHYGFDEVKWLLAPGACEDCIAQADQQWTVETIDGQIPVHPNCKCDFTPI